MPANGWETYIPAQKPLELLAAVDIGKGWVERIMEVVHG